MNCIYCHNPLPPDEWERITCITTCATCNCDFYIDQGTILFITFENDIFVLSISPILLKTELLEKNSNSVTRKSLSKLPLAWVFPHTAHEMIQRLSNLLTFL